MQGYYINLDHRSDRKQHFEQNIKVHPLFKYVERFSAIKGSPGYIGCGMSHIEILKKLTDEEGDCFLICEDDLQIINKNSFANFAANFDKVRYDGKWDLITLTPFFPIANHENDTIMQKYGFIKLDAAQTTTGYIVKKTFIKTLLDNFQYATCRLGEGKSYATFSIDQYWKRLFKSHKVYGFRYLFASQLSGYSDIEKRNVNYTADFLR